MSNVFQPNKPENLPPNSTSEKRGVPFDYVQAMLIVLGATLAGSIVDTFVTLDPPNLVMFYLLAVVIIALRFGYGPAVMAAVMSVVLFNFFFIPPQLTFHVADAQYLLTFSGLLVAGMVIANLTSRAQNQRTMAQSRERETAQLYSLSRQLSATVDAQIILRAILEHTHQTFHCEVAILLMQNDVLRLSMVTEHFEFDDLSLAKARHAQKTGKMVGIPMNAAGIRTYFFPLMTAHRVIGVMGIRLFNAITPEQQRLLEAFSAQSALAIEAALLGEEAQQARLLREKERLQNAILSSISHDLRTPLVSITGTLSSLRENDAYYDAGARRDLLDGAFFEAERLNRLVGNLLDMSRLEAGSLKLKVELYDLQEIIGVARSQLKERLNGRLRVDLPEDLPMFPVDLVLFAQVMVNLLDNALKYSPPDSPIDICARKVDESIIIEIADRGIGIPDEELPRIFTKFYRASSAKGYGGSGLGLSICQGIVEAHGGTISAEHRQGGGTCFIIKLPSTVNA